MKSIFDGAICQLCLQIDIKLSKISDTHHVFIERILKLNNIHYVPSENLSICAICTALLAKSYNFVQTVWKAQQIVCDLLQHTDLITKSTLKSLDRLTIGLNPVELSSIAVTNLDNNSSLELEVQSLEEHCSDINDIEEKAEISYYEEDLVDPNEYNETVLGVSHEDDRCDTKDPLLSVIKSKHVPLDAGTIQCDNTQQTPKKQKPKPKKRKVQLKRKRKYVNTKLKSRVTKKQQQLKEDPDYSPARDSTSHSEDSACDEYDDQGKAIKKPKPGLEYPRKCDHCSYEVPQSNKHYQHYLYMHPDIPYPYAPERNYACSVCGKLMTRALLISHERSHVAQSLQCAKCPKTFSNNKCLYKHMQNVHPNKILTCDYCSKLFKTKTDIVRHLRIHTGTKPFKCHMCEAAFAHSGNRSIHIRKIHQNIKDVANKPVKHNKRAGNTSNQDTSDM